MARRTVDPARRATVMLLVSAATTALVAGWMLLAVARDADAFRDAYIVMGWILMTLLALWLVAGVAWLRWFRGVADRVEAAGRARLRGRFWLLGWVLPAANLVIPKMMVNDAWHAADPPGERAPLPLVVQRWWALWVVRVVAFLGGRGVDPTAGGATGAVLWATFLVNETVAALLAAAVVRRLEERTRPLAGRAC